MIDYPPREAPASGGPQGRSLFLGLGSGRFPLHPFVVPLTREDGATEETYFVDAWDRKRDTARMKSFETGHTITDSRISDDLSEWGTPPE